MADFKLHIAEHFDAPVWRMEIDAVQDILFAEIRNVNTHEVSFASINLQTAESLYKNFRADESWLTGIESAYNGVLLLHYYEAQSSPAHKGLAAFSGTKAKLLWNNFNYAFDHLTVNGPVFYDTRFQPRKLFLADVFTGEKTRNYDAATDTEFINRLALPQHTVIPDVVLNHISAEPYGNLMYYLDYNNYRIVSLHTQWAGQLKQQLFIFDNGKPVFEDLLNADIQKMQPEAFVMYKNQLIYLKDKTEIKVLNL